MSLPDQKVYVNPSENLSSQDANSISEFLAQVHKTFVTSAIANTSCRISGLVVSLSNPGASPTLNVSSGLAFFVPPTDPHSYSGVIFAGSLNIGISSPAITTRTDAVDIIYNEQLGNDGGVIGATSPRDSIDNLGNITANSPFYTRKISNQNSIAVPTVVYVQDIINYNGGGATPGSVRLATFQVTAGGTIYPGSLTYFIPSIWDNQTWPTGSPNIAYQSSTLADSLASIRFQLSNIIGSTNWYDSVSGNNILNLLQLGNAPQFWAGTSTGSSSPYALTIPNYPVNSSIIPGTVITFTTSFTNSGPVFVSTNGGPNLEIKDATNTSFAGGEMTSGDVFSITYTGPLGSGHYQILGNATPIFNDLKTEVVNGSFEEWAGAIPAKWHVFPPASSSATLARENSITAVDSGSAVRFDLPAGATIGLTSAIIPISNLSTYFLKFKTFCTTANNTSLVSVNFLQYDGSTATVSGANQNLWTPPVGSYPTAVSTFYGILHSTIGVPSSPPPWVTIATIPSDARYFSVTIFAQNATGTLQHVWFDGFNMFHPGTSSMHVESSTASGTVLFTTGENTTEIEVLAVGAGGGGGSGLVGSYPCGGGGSGGTVRSILPVLPDTKYSYSVGAGGTNGGAQDRQGTTGGVTEVFDFNGNTVLLEALGGIGGYRFNGPAAGSSTTAGGKFAYLNIPGNAGTGLSGSVGGNGGGINVTVGANMFFSGGLGATSGAFSTPGQTGSGGGGGDADATHWPGSSGGDGYIYIKF